MIICLKLFDLSTASTAAWFTWSLSAALANQLRIWSYRLMDCQVESRHLLTMGARSIPRAEFLSILRASIDRKPDQHDWRFTWQWSGPEV